MGTRYLVGIDPGFNGTGAAALNAGTGELISTALVKPCGLEVAFPHRLARYTDALAQVINGLAFVDFVIEFPDRDDRKGEITDLFKLAALTGALTYACGENVTHVLPSEWKGNVPKDVHNQRVLGGLTEKELARFMAHGYGADASHNVVDAIGLAKWRFNNPRFVSRFGTSSTPLRSRIKKARASGKF